MFVDSVELGASIGVVVNPIGVSAEAALGYPAAFPNFENLDFCEGLEFGSRTMVAEGADAYES